MRAPSDLPPPRPRRRRRISSRGRILIGVIILTLIVAAGSLKSVAVFYTDFLWFDALGFEDVWQRILFARIALAVIFIGTFFLLLLVNLTIADRLAPVFRPPGPEEELMTRYHATIGQRPGLIRVVVSLLLALLVGSSAASQWRNWILFTNRVDFGIEDPQFGRDIGFYVFELPFLTYVVSWMFAAFIVIFIVTAIAHYVNGGIRLQTVGQRVTPQVKAHLSLLLGVLALLKAIDYWLDRFLLTVSSRGVVDGATYTDVNAQLPAIQLLLLISLLAFVLLIVNIWRRGWVLPVLAVGLWALVAIVAGNIYPQFIQRLRVNPDEQAKELPFIERNITATRAAYGLQDVDEQRYDYTADVGDRPPADDPTLSNVRLLDPAIVPSTFEQRQAERDFYRFGVSGQDLDVDRYLIDGELTQVVIGARQLNPNDLPQSSWEGQRLNFTHGYGVAIAPANKVVGTGEPEFVVGGVPVESANEISLDQPQIYVGESLGGYAIVNTGAAEVDYVDGDNQQVPIDETTPAGVEIGGLFRRTMFALRFSDLNPLISDPVDSDSRVIYVRDIRSRVEKLAPFLDFDDDPYPVIVDGRIVFVADAYTTTSLYPYSQQADVNALPSSSGLRKRFNYARNSVKVAIDGYDGQATFYAVDPDDPLLQAYQKAFPELFSSLEEMPAELVDHIRYPPDLFTVQTNMWARYQLAQANEFYTQAAGWSVAQDPGIEVRTGPQPARVVTDPETGLQTVRQGERAPSQYLLMALPGEEDAEFVLLRPFVPFSATDERQELTAFMVARSDGSDYGDLQVFEMPGTSVQGPVQADSTMLSNEAVSDRITQLNQQGSDVRLGNMVIVPIDDTILYVRPLYVEASSGAKLPRLEGVVVAVGDRVEVADTMGQAITALYGAPLESESEPEPEAATDDGEPSEPSTATEPVPEAAELLDQAEQLFVEADAALEDGDLGGYQDKIDEARVLLQQAEAIISGDDQADGAADRSSGDEDKEPVPVVDGSEGET